MADAHDLITAATIVLIIRSFMHVGVVQTPGQYCKQFLAQW
jgi:hypothetical protein